MTLDHAPVATAIRDRNLLAIDTGCGFPIDLVDLDDDLWTEPCQGCDGTGHMGRRVSPTLGPCDTCWGCGRALFAFSAEDPICAVNVPMDVAVRHAGELLVVRPWIRHYPRTWLAAP